jgi:hypothetical protein
MDRILRITVRKRRERKNIESFKTRKNEASMPTRHAD